MTQYTFPTINCPDPQPHKDAQGKDAQGIARVVVDDKRAQLIVIFKKTVPSDTNNYLSSPRSYSLTGGQRLFPRILKVTPRPPDIAPELNVPPGLTDHCVRLELDSLGNFSIYTLTVNGPDIDPFFSSYKLRFRLACDDAFDCRKPAPAPPLESELPIVIDYLAKDYASFRRALLDFIPTRLPAWTERSEADIGMMLLELFAATADNLSYMQDRVANEAFLSSATQRRSVAGHLALIGYEMDEGASAHTWLQFQVSGEKPIPLKPGFQVSTQPGHDNDLVIVFETYAAATLYSEHSDMRIYDWGKQNCCLPSTALSAALIGKYEHLRAGDYLLIKDTRRNHADIVRLTSRPEIIRPDPIKAHPVDSLTIVRWSPAKPLHYDYCIQDTVVRGNLVLATHGETVTSEKDTVLRKLDEEQKKKLQVEIEARKPGQRVPRQRFRLARAPLAFLDSDTMALAAPLDQKQPGPGKAEPRSVSTLKIQVNDQDWQEQHSLLDSRADAHVYRVEIDDEGYATVVFGDGIFGQRPDETATITASYRIGGGKVGNLGADTLGLPRMGDKPPSWLIRVTNPLPAVGGRDLESRDHARRLGPATFQKPLVAVTASDYQAAAQNFKDLQGQQPIQRANASFRWTGSWLTVTLAVDPHGTEGLSADLRQALLTFLDSRRLAGYDLEVREAVYVPIDLVIEFCHANGFFATDVQKQLLQALSNADLPGGRKGFFHPDNFSFGDNLYVSKLYAAIMAVPGVESAQIKGLYRSWTARQDIQTNTNLGQGYLSVGLDEIIQLDNDRNFPQHGTLTIRPKGGR